MGLIGILLGLLLAGGGWFFHMRSAKKAGASAGWPTAQGTVTACQVVHKTETDSDGDSTDVYYAKPIYTYAVAGSPYTGDRVSFGGQNRFYVEKAAQAIVDKYPAGSTVQVRYNPENPKECALESKKPPMTAPIVLTIVGVIFMVVGAGLLA